MPVIGQPTAKRRKLSKAAPREVHTPTRDIAAIIVAKYSALYPQYNFFVGFAADTIARHGADAILGCAMVDNGACLAVTGVVGHSWLWASLQPFEDRLVHGFTGTPLWASFAFHLDKIKTSSGVFDTIVAVGTVPFLNFTAEVLLGEPL